jgi:ornithine cyclodeaminase
MQFYSALDIENSLDYKGFIPFLKKIFQSAIEVPNRLHYDIKDGSVLIMPAWNSEYFGIKIVTVNPKNVKINLPSIHADYIIKSIKTGETLGILDGQRLTAKRTAAASALAASFLARKDSSKLLMIGNGALAPELILAHATIRPIKEVKIWGRNSKNVQQLISSKNWRDLDVSMANDINQAILWADVISCATLSKTALIHGKYLREGQHVDLVGSYKPDMREADNETISKSNIFVDTFHGAKESGDLAIPIQDDILKPQDIHADLIQLSKNDIFTRQSKSEITLFKSVGLALEDLAAAIYVINKLKEKHD